MTQMLLYQEVILL